MTWRVFYSYSHKDAELREKLATHLRPLVHQRKIVEWCDREIEPGTDWQTAINEQLESAHLILLLLSADYLASEYCFGVEVERALERLKRGDARVVPVLLRPCLWDESRFSELQIIPRSARAISSWTSEDEAFQAVARELRELVSQEPPAASQRAAAGGDLEALRPSMELVRGQISAYAQLYERTRQRMPTSPERTVRLSDILHKMRALAVAAYPLLDELANSPSPGDRLAAIAILQVFATERALPFIVQVVSSEKPFVTYQALKALHFAVGALDPRFYPQLMEAMHKAQDALNSASVADDSDRQEILRNARSELNATIESLSVQGGKSEG
jgi:hypothetical protein